MKPYYLLPASPPEGLAAFLDEVGYPRYVAADELASSLCMWVVDPTDDEPVGLVWGRVLPQLPTHFHAHIAGCPGRSDRRGWLDAALQQIPPLFDGTKVTAFAASPTDPRTGRLLRRLGFRQEGRLHTRTFDHGQVQPVR